MYKSIRAFIGAKEYETSRNFYRDLGFKETPISPTMAYFQKENLGFYLQDYYSKEWVENTMIFVEVDHVEDYREELLSLELDKKYKGVKVTAIVYNEWGKEFFLYDPSGILWHFGLFY